MADERPQVIDIASARKRRVGKVDSVIGLLRTMKIVRGPRGLLHIADDGAQMAVVERAFVSAVIASYFAKHGEPVSASAVKSALTSMAGLDLPTIAEGTREGGVGSPLVVLVREQADLFHDQYGAAYAYARSARDTLNVRSKKFRLWIDRLHLDTFGAMPDRRDRADALDELEGLAIHRGAMQSVHTRIAEHADRIYIDLANPARDVVEVDSNGWRLVTDPPVRFVRHKGMGALPTPVSDGSVKDLRRVLNVFTEADFVLIVAWLLAALRPRGPYPILAFVAEQGSAKSTTSRILRSLVDPNVSPIRAPPRTARDLVIAAKHAHVLAFDNLSGISPTLSDALCRMSTGGGFSTRTLYTDEDETIIDVTRPIVVNGIDDLATRPDLADRCIVLTLPTIQANKRRPESDLARELAAAAPGVLGALLTALSGALSRESDVQLAELPRMADFARFATAAELPLGWPEGAFMAAYESNRQNAIAVAIEGDAVAQAVIKLIGQRNGSEWTGIASELLPLLAQYVPDGARGDRWPGGANALSGRLRRAAPLLRSVGLDITLPTGRPRIMRLAQAPADRPDRRTDA